jgi:hypothetical protein
MTVDAAADDVDPEFHRVRNNDDEFPTGAALRDRFPECVEQSSVCFRELAPVHD